MALKKIPMTLRQVELVNNAYSAVKQSREQRDLDVLLEGMASSLDGKLINADTDAKEFTVEVPDIEERKEA